MDEEIEKARSRGKKVSLSVAAGVRTPRWVYTAGAVQFSYVWDKLWGPPVCSQQTIPVPWDSIYLSKWKAFVSELGRRYDPDATIVYIKITGINASTQEAILPHSDNRRIERQGASCFSGDDIRNWQRIGYTRTRVEATWGSIADTFAQSFPNKKLGLMIGPSGFPPIDSNGNVIPNRGADTELAHDLIAEGIRKYGKRFVLQNNGLSALKSWDELQRVSSRVTVGWQMAWSATDDPGCRMNGGQRPCDPHGVLRAAVDRGIDSGASFLEIYISDILNPQLQDVLAQAHSRLGQPTEHAPVNRPARYRRPGRRAWW